MLLLLLAAAACCCCLLLLAKRARKMTETVGPGNWDLCCLLQL